MSFSGRTENWIYKLLCRQITEIEFTRVENECCPGMPDIYYYAKNKKPEGWIELKVIKSKGSTIKLRPSQRRWIKSYLKGDNERRIFILILHQNTLHLCYCKDIDIWPDRIKLADITKRIVIEVDNLKGHIIKHLI